MEYWKGNSTRERKSGEKGVRTYLLDTICIRDNPNSRETFLQRFLYNIYCNHFLPSFFFFFRLPNNYVFEKIEKILDKIKLR